MKKLLAVAVLALAARAEASPYFRLLDLNKPHVSMGACADPVNVGQSKQCTVFSIVHHSAKDGAILFPGEDWTLLGMGYAASGTGVNPVLGPSWNLMPAGAKALSWASTAIGLTALGQELESFDQANTGRLTMAFGPAWSVDPSANWKGSLALFAGAAWSF